VLTRSIAGILVSAFLAVGASAAGPTRPLKVGAWVGGAYTDPNSGAFSYCAAATPYKSGITFFVSVTRDYQWSLAFSDPNWTLNAGQTIPIELTFNGGSKFNVVGTARSRDFVTLPMPDNSQLISRFRAATTMTAVANNNVFQFALTTTSRLLPALVHCVAQETGTAAKAPPPAAPARATAPASNTNNPAANANNAELYTEAVELATNFILNSGLERPKLLARSETPADLVAHGAAWRSSDAAGAVRILPAQPNVKGIDVTAAIIAGDAKECRGKFASGRTSELLERGCVSRFFDLRGFRRHPHDPVFRGPAQTRRLRPLLRRVCDGGREVPCEPGRGPTEQLPEGGAHRRQRLGPAPAASLTALEPRGRAISGPAA
jgi:hypothetical protein